ncbi:glycosyl hydrolase family 10 [Colletotrichum orchidophilum]|uniref:Beta-xylanase n=1 Tax=Colletotrichum orchidophilum TaxID=1209926 RepID=A0A1G4B0Y1_9PEZI|nr:glycosyl hydrolase family 10 [Colletotrichum orchidophilum]OHE95078.1 glycosyl hydrolase family 10 [Colletotrichum orchidophilum]
MKFSLSLLLAPLAVAGHPTTDDGAPAPAAAAVARGHTHHHGAAHRLLARQSPTSIDKLFKAKGKLYIGVSGDNGIMQQGKTAAVIQQDFGQVTPEYSMKWDATEPTRGAFDFTNADFLVNFAQTNGKLIRGHTLLWHEALPAWVAAIKDKATMTKVVETHVKTVVGKYKGKIRSWLTVKKDVVNEAFNDNGTLRSTVFSNVLGEAYIGIAFRAARVADPAAKLYINDYNLDNAGWGKVTAVVNKVNQWIGQGIPIDGIGSQAHLAANMSGNIQAALEALARSRASEIAITELDIPGAPPNDYATVVAACLHVPKCKGVTVWGVSDKQSWMATAKPLLFDDNWKPKPAYNAIVARLRK